MFTKLFKKSHDPYELGGRWYKMRISFAENGASVIESDIPVISQQDLPASLACIAILEDTSYTIRFAHGLLIDYTVVPVALINESSDPINMTDFVLSVQYVNTDNLNMYYTTLTMSADIIATFDLYLHIVER